MINYLGQEIPFTQFRTGGLQQYSPTPYQADQAKVDLARDQFEQSQKDKERVFGGQFPSGASGALSPTPTPAANAPSSGGLFGGFDLLRALESLSGASTDVSTTVGDMNQQKKGTFDALAQLLSALGVSQNSLMGNLAQTAMSGKLGLTNADVDAQKANQAAALAASQSNQARDKRLSDMALFQGLIGSNVSTPGMREISSQNIDRPDTNVNLQALLQPQPPAPPPSAGPGGGAFNLNTFMGGNRVKPMRPMIPAGALA